MPCPNRSERPPHRQGHEGAAPGRTTRQKTGRIFEVFTDGSRMKGNTGAGWSVTRGLQSTAEGRVHLGCHATVFQAETVAIHDFLSWLNNDTAKYKRGDRFRIWSDSQSAIQAIKARKTKSAVVGDCQEQLRKARTNYHIELGWIKGHADIPGNEWADALAKEASELRPNICEPAVPLPTGEIKRRIDGWMREKWLSEWANRKDCRQTKAMLGKPKDYNSDQGGGGGQTRPPEVGQLHHRALQAAPPPCHHPRGRHQHQDLPAMWRRRRRGNTATHAQLPGNGIRNPRYGSISTNHRLFS
jgi:ribonuclease HI